MLGPNESVLHILLFCIKPKYFEITGLIEIWARPLYDLLSLLFGFGLVFGQFIICNGVD